MSRRISVIVDERGVNKVANSLNRLNTIGNKTVGVLHRVMSGVKSVGQWIYRYRYRITAAFSAAMYAIGRTYMSFEDTMVRTKVALRTTDADLKLLEETALNIGKTTSYSAGEAAEGMKILGRAGMATKDIIASIAPVLDLSYVAEIDLGEAAEKTAHILQMWNMEASEATRIADVLAMSEQVATGSILETADALKFAGIGAAKAGISFEETTGMILELAKGGILGSMAGRSLRMSFIRFERIKTGQTAKLMTQTFERLGPAVNQAVRAVQKGQMGFVEFVGVLTRAGATLGDMANIFEAQAAPAMLQLGQATGESYQKVVNVLVESGGYAKDAAAEIAGTLTATVKKIKASLGVIAIELGSTVAPDLKDWLNNTLHPWINDVTEAWNTGGDTWQEKLRSVWDGKLKPEFERGLASLGDLIAKWTPKLAEGIGNLAADLVPSLVKGTAAGIGKLTAQSWSGWSALGDWMMAHTTGFFATTIPNAAKGAARAVANGVIGDLNALPGVNIPSLGKDPKAGHAGQGTAGTLAGMGILPPGWTPTLTSQPRESVTEHARGQMEFFNVSEMVSMFSQEFGPSEQLDALLKIADNTEGDAASGGSSPAWLSSLVDKMGLSDPLGSVLGPIGDTLLSYVTDPIVSALDKHLGPTTTRLQKLADRALRVLDVPLGALNMALDGILMLLGQDYTSGRLTNEGAYQYAYAPAGGGSLSASSALQVGSMHFHGVSGGEDAGHQAVHEIAQYEGLASRQQARSLRRGMVKSEAQER